MRIIVIGGTGLAEQVADALHRAGMRSRSSTPSPGANPRSPKGRPARHLRGRAGPVDPRAAGALKADVLVACTRSDEDNLVISLLAKKRFNVPRVIARVNDPASDELFNQSWGVDALRLAGHITGLDDQARELTPSPARPWPSAGRPSRGTGSAGAAVRRHDRAARAPRNRTCHRAGSRRGQPRSDPAPGQVIAVYRAGSFHGGLPRDHLLSTSASPGIEPTASAIAVRISAFVAAPAGVRAGDLAERQGCGRPSTSGR